MRAAVLQTAAVEMGAVGIATLLTTSLLDIPTFDIYGLLVSSFALRFIYCYFFSVRQFFCLLPPLRSRFRFPLLKYMTFDQNLHVTGLVGAGVLAVLGLGILPLKRSSIKQLMRQRIGDLRGKLNNSLQDHFSK